MKHDFFYIICLCFVYLKCTVSDELTIPTVKNYLEDRSRVVRNIVSDKFKTERLIEIREIARSGDISRGYNGIFTLFNTTFVFLDNKLHKVLLGNGTVTIIEATEELSVTGNITFNKVVEFQELGLILVNADEEIYIYGFNKHKVFFIHSILASNASDAHFFINQNSLYLIVIKNKGYNLAISTIYKWLGLHFNEHASIITTGATKVTSFTSYSKSEIIVILQSFPGVDVPSIVYEFNFGRIKKIQHLNTINPTYIDVSKTEDKTYVWISNQQKNSMVYVWDGTKLVETFNFESDIGNGTFFTSGMPFSVNIIVIPLKDKLQAFHVLSKGIQLIGESNYTKNFTFLVDIHKGLTTNNITYVVGVSGNSTVVISAMHFKAHYSNAKRHIADKYTLRNCFNTLESNLFNQKAEFRETMEMLSQVNVGASRQPTTGNLTIRMDTEGDDPTVKSKLNDLTARLHRLQPILSKYENKELQNITINDKVVKGSITAELLSGKNIDLKLVNNRDWVPKNWLRYKQTQNITGPVTANKVVTTLVNITTLDALFPDILWNRKECKITNLTADRILTENMNGMKLKNIYLKSSSQPIQGLKSFENLKTKEARVELLNGQLPNVSLTVFNSFSNYSLQGNTIQFDDNLEVGNLVVDVIDDIHWNTFRDSVFRINVTKEIDGHLAFAKFKANNITLKTLRGTEVEYLLTTSTDQDISADIKIAKIVTQNIIPNRTNNVKLSESAVQIKDNLLVEGSIKFDKMYVRKDLKLVGKLDKELFWMNEGHVMGTNVSDLWQRYDGVIKIKGDVYLKNINFLPQAKLLVGGEDFDTNISSVYWTKNTKQSIPVHCNIQNGIKVSHLLANQLNDINFDKYMLNKNMNQYETSYHFKRISVTGNIVLNDTAKHLPDITKLRKEAITTTGRYYISGKKKYTDTLSAEDLTATVLSGVVVNSTLTSKSKINLPKKKTFRNIIVKGNLTGDIESIETINTVNITELLETTIYINKPQNLDHLQFKNITVEDLWVTKLNDHQVNKHITNVQQMLASSSINNLTIYGNVTLKNVTGVDQINDIKFKDLLEKSLKKGKHGGILVDLDFRDNVKVNNLIVTRINDINMRAFTKRLLYRSNEQNITARYSFKNIKAENIEVFKINNLSLNLLDTFSDASQTIHAPGGIEFYSPVLKKSVYATKTSPHNLKATLKNIKNPPSKNWHSVEVKGNATFLDPTNIVNRLFEKAVTMNTENVIKVPVKFSKHVMTSNVISKGRINGVDLQEILDDAVLMESDEEQVITGRKFFPTIRISNATVMKNTDIPVVNRIVIPDLDKAIVRKQEAGKSIIKGMKTFSSGLQCDQIYTKKVSDIDVNNIVSTTNPKKIPQASFEFIEVKNLNISSVNNVNFKNFLKNRLLTTGVQQQTVTGIYFFDELKLKRIHTSANTTINDIKIDNVVFDIDQQNISASKRFIQAVEVFGNVTCMYINGVRLAEVCNNSIALNENVTFNVNLTILRPSTVDGRITADYINGYPIETIKKTLHEGTVKSKTKDLHLIQTDISEKIKRSINSTAFLESDYMYIERTEILQIPIPNTSSAKTMESNGYVLIHVNGEESGDFCGLPESCTCPVQYSIEISPEHSVNMLPNKGSQRIFNYNDEKMIVHLLTNSISTDSECRSENAKVINEVSMMTWNIIGAGNLSKSFNQYDQYITGYISGAEFFTLHEHTYAVISRYYDPTTDSHDLDCYVIKFNDDKSKAERIQEISTNGAWSLYLFHTAQGVTLIIGNLGTIRGQEETQIYRFNENSQQFHLLRIVPSYGCSMATGVVLGTDSLIVLAHQYAPLKILKYNPYVDNYYFYQSFELESPVVGLSVFYTGGFGISDAYLCTITANENYFIYSFRFIEGWKLESSGELEGLRNFIAFELNRQSYLFAPSSKISSLLTVVKHGSV